MSQTIGYIIPEFPGQTHIFFWREKNALEKLGIRCEWISTRKPMARLVSHSWAQEAMTQTTYLSPPTAAMLLSGLGRLILAGPPRWIRTLSAIFKSDTGRKGGRLRVAALAFAGSQLAALARRRGWSHMHVHSAADAANAAMFARLLGGPPYSLTLHGPLEDYGPNQKLKWRHAAFAIVITQKLLGEVKATLNGSLPASVDVAPMGVETNQFHRTTPYQSWQSGTPLKIFACGRLNPCKGHDDLIRAIGLLRDRGIDAHLTIAGADDSAGGTYRATLEELARSLNLSDRITLLGAVSEAAVRSGLESSHVFALASLHEPLGVAIMEAMAMQMPVVVTRGGGVTELVQDGIDGILGDARDPQSMADGIQRVIADPALACALAQRARTKVEESFRSDQSARVLARRLGARGTGF